MRNLFNSLIVKRWTYLNCQIRYWSEVDPIFSIEEKTFVFFFHSLFVMLSFHEMWAKSFFLFCIVHLFDFVNIFTDESDETVHGEDKKWFILKYQVIANDRIFFQIECFVLNIVAKANHFSGISVFGAISRVIFAKFQIGFHACKKNRFHMELLAHVNLVNEPTGVIDLMLRMTWMNELSL